MESSKKSEYLIAYRLVAPRWVPTAMSGEGSMKYGGRWNSIGRPVVYMGGSRALAALELLVHLSTPSSRAKRYQFLEVKIPQGMVDELSVRDLPRSWRAAPAERETAQYGDRWLKGSHSLALKVPSVLVPEEWNVLLNPVHKDFSKLEVSGPKDFRYDPRFYVLGS